jgi:hypothetical protein
MAKCGRCGKGGIFHKVTASGKCNDCNRILKLEEDERILEGKIKLKADSISKLEEDFRLIQQNRDSLYHEISEKAKADAIQAIADQIDIRTNELRAVERSVTENRTLKDSTAEELAGLQKATTSNANKLRKMQTLFKSMQYSAKKYFDEIEPSRVIVSDQHIEEAEDLLSTTIVLKLNLMDIRELKKLYIQNGKLIKELLIRYQSRYTTKANISIYRLMVIALEAELQNVLYNLKYSKLDKAVSDIKTITAKYLKIATDGNQNIVSTVTKFIGEIEYLFIEAIKIEYEYYIQRERIKEEQKAIKDQMRQEAAERKLLEAERRKVEIEESKYENEIANIREQISSTADELKIKQLEDRIAKVQAQLDEVEKEKAGIINLQNGKAGYIYIISNLGSFGDTVFKIGMTRRLNPQDRVDELGDASVPFKFDVHSFIFSDSAPDLENSLHRNLNSKRVNRINLRKEFFKTTIDELEDLVYSLEPTAEFNKTMLAEQYLQSMAVDEVPDSVEIVDEDDFEDEEEA